MLFDRCWQQAKYDIRPRSHRWGFGGGVKKQSLSLRHFGPSQPRPGPGCSCLLMSSLIQVMLFTVPSVKQTHYPSHSSENVPRSRSHLRGACRGDYRYSRRRFGFVRSSRQYFLEKGRAETEGRLGEITRSLPSHLLYKSLDGIFKEWKVEKSGSQPFFMVCYMIVRFAEHLDH